MNARAVFDEEEHARAVAARLARDGFDAHVERERFAGEDDDEDHAWAVVTDAPEPMLELYVDEYDGFLDATGLEDTPAAPVVPPLDLPQEPRRVKNRPGG